MSHRNHRNHRKPHSAHDAESLKRGEPCIPSLLPETSGRGVGLAGININNQDGFVAYLVLNAIIINKKHPHTRKVGDAAYLGKRGKQLYLPVNHPEKFLAVFVAAVTLVKVVQDGFETVGKLRAVNNL